MAYTGTKYDQSICSTVNCTHGREMHAANPRNANEPRHCTTPGCRCGAFRPTPIRPSVSPPQPKQPAVTEIDSRRRPNTKPDRKVRAFSFGRSPSIGRSA